MMGMMVTATAKSQHRKHDLLKLFSGPNYKVIIIDGPPKSQSHNFRRSIETSLSKGPALPSVAKKSEKKQKLWTDVYPSRIAPFLMILYSFWSSWPDLSFETHFVFFVFLCDGRGQVLMRVGWGGMSNFSRFTGKNRVFHGSPEIRQI